MKNHMPSVSDTTPLESESQAAAAQGLLHGVVLAAGGADSLDLLWAWGDASVEPARKPMQTQSVFDIASLTKVVATATACGLCLDRGLLDPEAPVSNYFSRIGEFPGSSIRVCDLATHYSGYNYHSYHEYPAEEILVRAIESPPDNPPREKFVYSCRNYLILGALVEQLTGTDLGTFCAREVFEPLGMSHTAFGSSKLAPELLVPSEQLAGVISDAQARKAERPVGNAGLFSCAEDLSRFARMILQGGMCGAKRILGPDALAWLTRPCSPPGLPPRSFGWDMRPVSECLYRPSRASASAIGHAGWTGQSLWIDPELGRYVVVLTNRTHCPLDPDNYDTSMRLRARLADLVLTPSEG